MLTGLWFKLVHCCTPQNTVHSYLNIIFTLKLVEQKLKYYQIISPHIHSYILTDIHHCSNKCSIVSIHDIEFFFSLFYKFFFSSSPLHLHIILSSLVLCDHRASCHKHRLWVKEEEEMLLVFFIGYLVEHGGIIRKGNTHRLWSSR